MTLERSNLDDQFQEKKVDLIKREDVAVASDQRLVSLGMKFFPGRYIYPKKKKLFTYNVLFFIVNYKIYTYQFQNEKLLESREL